MTRGSDRGDTLVEILVALAILGIGMVALLSALATNITVTGTNREQAQAQAALASGAEHLKGLRSFTFACPGGTIAITDAQVPRPAGYTLTYGPNQPVEGQPCADLVSVPLTVTGNGYTTTVQVVKRP